MGYPPASFVFEMAFWLSCMQRNTGRNLPNHKLSAGMHKDGRVHKDIHIP